MKQEQVLMDKKRLSWFYISYKKTSIYLTSWYYIKKQKNKTWETQVKQLNQVGTNDLIEQMRNQIYLLLVWLSLY